MNRSWRARVSACPAKQPSAAGLQERRAGPGDCTCIAGADEGHVQLDARNHPVLVCCTSGIFQTAPLVGCLRRVQNWGLTAILDEYRAFAGPKGRIAHEQYIEFFDVDLVTLPGGERGAGRGGGGGEGGERGGAVSAGGASRTKPACWRDVHSVRCMPCVSCGESRLPAWFTDYNLMDVRQEVAELEELRQQLTGLEEKESQAAGGRLAEDDEREKRRIVFALRCAEAQRSTIVCSPGIRMGKQSLLDDEDDD